MSRGEEVRVGRKGYARGGCLILYLFFDSDTRAHLDYVGQQD
jgi:hypothetical protein